MDSDSLSMMFIMKATFSQNGKVDEVTTTVTFQKKQTSKCQNTKMPSGAKIMLEVRF